MSIVHLVILDLFLPEEMAACAGLHLPVLEKLLARGTYAAASDAPLSLEAKLCGMFGMPCRPDAPIAPVSAAFDGLGAFDGTGGWLRADPVHLSVQRDQLVLLPVEVCAADAAQLCAAVNDYFAGQGMALFAPHTRRWYMRTDCAPDMMTVPFSQAEGRNVRDLLPRGRDAMRWHRVLNEIQMLLFAHPVNASREARGILPVNSLWLWGSGANVSPQKTYEHVSSDEEMAGMLAAAAGIPFSAWAADWRNEDNRQLLVFAGLHAALKSGGLDAWRAALQQFETTSAEPLWRALRAGKITQVQVDVLGAERVRQLTRADTLAFWRRARPLARYSLTGE